jgi:hypothetical protein
MVHYRSGFTWTELYNMPVWLRKFYYKKTHDALKEKQKAQEKTTKKSKVSKPSIAPKRK